MLRTTGPSGSSRALPTALHGKRLPVHSTCTMPSSWALSSSPRDAQCDHRTERRGAVLGRHRPLLPASQREPCPGSQRLSPAPKAPELSAKCWGGEGKRKAEERYILKVTWSRGLSSSLDSLSALGKATCCLARVPGPEEASGLQANPRNQGLGASASPALNSMPGT